MDGPGPDPSRQEAPHPHMAAVDPTGGFIIVPDLGADILRVYSIDKPTGFLTSCANVTAAPGSGPRHAAFWEGAGGTMMYLANELGNDVTVYSVAYPTEEGQCLSLFSIQTDTPYPADQAVKNGQKIGEVRVSVS
jgi:6-phosphogluconolactonase (cycloisomerase 2 family)